MSPDYIGALKPTQRVLIRRGAFVRSSPGSYVNITAINNGGPPAAPGNEDPENRTMMQRFPMKANLGDHKNNKEEFLSVWSPSWVPQTGYAELPNVYDVKLGEKSKNTQGIEIATVEFENIAYLPLGGSHRRWRGYFSPLRGYLAPGMPTLVDEDGTTVVAANEWARLLEYALQITVFQGLGETEAKTFTGLIEDIDYTSRPDRITLTARSFGQVFSDTNLLTPAVDPYAKNPIVFSDRLQASGLTPVGYNANASTEREGHEAALAVDHFNSTYWQSSLGENQNVVQYIEIALPEGLYQDFELELPPGFSGMNMYVSLRAAVPEHSVIQRDGVELKVGGGPPADLTAEQWIDVFKGAVPEHPTVPFLNVQENVPANAKVVIALEEGNHDYVVGTNSVLRLSFTHLAPTATGELKPRYSAGVATFFARRQELEGGEEGAPVVNHWVLVDDISDVVKIICAWAGFKEWEIEDTGARLPKRLIYDPTKTYMDVIKELELGVGFTFFMKDPTANEESIGVPCWRKTRVVTRLGEPAWKATGLFKWAAAATVTDTTLLTAVDVKQTAEELRAVIRVYGLTNTLPGDIAAGITGHRLVYSFRPPWAGTLGANYADSRLAGVMKQLDHKDLLFATIDDCKFAAFYIALQEALSSLEATIEVPGFPGFDLDEHVILLDLGSGLSTRLAITGRTSDFAHGEKTKWITTLKGALIDTPDVVDMLRIIYGEATPNGGEGEWGASGGIPGGLGYG